MYFASGNYFIPVENCCYNIYTMEKLSNGYSLKNTSIPNKNSYLINLIDNYDTHD